MKLINIVFAATLLCLSLAARADGPATGPNGGQLKHSGKYHLELVVKDTALTVYLTGDKDAKVVTKGASGSATVLAGKGTSNVKLEPGGENALAGSGSFQPAPDMKVVVSITLPGQPPIQARFTPLETPKHQASHHEAAKSPAQSASAADGEVRKVDKDAKKITIKHGPIPGLDMPAMTMVFRVKDPAMLDQVKAGDKIRFDADKIGGQLTVIRVEPAK